MLPPLPDDTDPSDAQGNLLPVDTRRFDWRRPVRKAATPGQGYLYAANRNSACGRHRWHGMTEAQREEGLVYQRILTAQRKARRT